MLKPLFLFFSIAMSLAGLSQPKPVKPQTTNDPEAEKYLKALKSKFDLLKTYKLSYKMSITDANNSTTTIDGTYIGSGEKFIATGNNTKTISDGKTQWVIESADKEIQINTVKTSKGNKIETPIDIIKRYNKFFKYRIKEPLENNAIILELIPLEKNSPYFKIDLTIHTGKMQIVSAKLYDRGGNRILFNISKTEENIKLASDVFTVNTANYKGYEVMDMR